MNAKELVQLLQKNGWTLKRISGSHHVMKKDGKRLSVPVHGSKDLSRGTLLTILKEAGLK